MHIPGATEAVALLNRPRTGGIARFLTPANLVGLIGALITLSLLLALPNDPPYWNMRLPLYLLVGVATMLNPRIALYLLPFTVPWGSTTLSDPLGYGSELLIASLVTGWLLGFTLRHQGVRMQRFLPATLDREALVIPWYLTTTLLSLLAAMLLSMTVSTSLGASVKELLKWLEVLAILLIGSQYLRTRRQVWLLIVCLSLATLSQAFYGFYQYFFNIGPASFQRGSGLRVYGSFGQPNPYAGFINLALSVTLSLTLFGRGLKMRLCAGAATGILLAAGLLAQSRGGEIALVAILFFIALAGLSQLRPLVRLAMLPALMIIEAGLLEIIPERVFHPVLRILGLTQLSFSRPSSEDFSTAERLAHWWAGLKMFFAHPILGVGIGNYPLVYPDYYITIFKNPLGHAHDYYINIAAETGFIGLIAYVLFLTGLFMAGSRAFKTILGHFSKQQAIQNDAHGECSRPPLTRLSTSALARSRMITCQIYDDRALAIGLLAALISVAIHNVVDNLYVHSITNFIALLLIALIRLAKVTPTVDSHGGSC